MPEATCAVPAVDDIEDIIGLDELAPVDQRPPRVQVVPKAKVLRRRRAEEAKRLQADKDEAREVALSEPDTTASVIPGTQSVYVKTWGCSHNSSDSEYMAGQLAAYGYTITEDRSAADLWLLNSCTVKGPAEDHFRNEVVQGRSQGKHVVVAGCVPQGQRELDYVQGLSIIGVQQIDRVVEVVEETLKGHSVRLLGPKKVDGKKVGGARLDLPKIRKNPLIEIIAINTGCLNRCTYCKTKHARGELGSYQPEDIVARAKQSFREGVVEIWLTSEDLGAYGRDIGVTLPELLWKLVEVIPDGCMLRLGMTNPPYILEHLEEVAKILCHPRVYSFLHVPVQSGSDSVLADMKREYCIADFQRVMDFLKNRVPDLTVATDLICGFPTETAADFELSLALVRQYCFPSLFINQFFARPGTPAARMQPRVPAQEIKRRTRAASDLFQSYVPYDHKIGLIQEVLVTEVSHDKHYYVAHNKSYDQVLIERDESLMGKKVLVRIVSSGKHYMMADVLRHPSSTGDDERSATTPESDGTTAPAPLAPLMAVRPNGIPEPLPRGYVSGLRETGPGVTVDCCLLPDEVEVTNMGRLQVASLPASAFIRHRWILAGSMVVLAFVLIARRRPSLFGTVARLWAEVPSIVRNSYQ